MLLLAQISEGIAFDPFLRGFLSVLVGVIVLIGGTYLLVATNTGSRSGFLISMAALFGWFMLMGVVWVIYAIGWVGEAQSWELVEINRGDLTVAEEAAVDGLVGVNLASQATSTDPDEAQIQALEFAESQDLDGWAYLTSSDSIRGEATSSADAYLVENEIFGSTAEYVPTQFGAFTWGGKPAAADDDGIFTRAGIKIRNVLQFWSPRELVAVQVQGIIEQPTEPGQAPPVATADAEKPVVTVVLERDRGGPIPWLVGGARFTPMMFTIFSTLIFGVLCWALHTRDKREAEILAAAAA